VEISEEMRVWGLIELRGPEEAAERAGPLSKPGVPEMTEASRPSGRDRPGAERDFQARGERAGIREKRSAPREEGGEAPPIPPADKIAGVRVPSPGAGGGVSRIADLTAEVLRGVEVPLKGPEAAEAEEAAENRKGGLPQGGSKSSFFI
jgi:hypothetical protein